MTNLRKRLDITNAFLYKKETTVNSTVDACLCKCTMRVMCARCCVIFTRQQHAHMTRIVYLNTSNYKHDGYVVLSVLDHVPEFC